MTDLAICSHSREGKTLFYSQINALTSGLKVFWFSKDNPTGHSEEADRRRWEDNIKEWTGMDFASSTRVA